MTGHMIPMSIDIIEFLKGSKIVPPIKISRIHVVVVVFYFIHKDKILNINLYAR